MSKVTIFSAPKPFSDPHINIIQLNAVRSWKLLGSDAEVILIGDEPGIKENAELLDVQHIPNVQVNNLGTPLINSIFSLARQASTQDLLIYLNADILLLPETMEVIQKIHKLKKEFLIVGRRWDLDITAEITFDSDWSNDMKIRVEKEGKLQSPAAMDYFVFLKYLYQDIPPFAVGRAGWDNWMIYHGMQQIWPVIDVTPALIVIHQNHDYSHLPDGKPHFDLDESIHNVNLGGGYTKSYDLLDVKWEFKDGRIGKVQLTLSHLLRKIERFINPQKREGWRWELTRKLRKLRRKLS
ncbi:MAG: hypothetical protein ACC633_09340 [Anaerolineales bacterium]